MSAVPAAVVVDATGGVARADRLRLGVSTADQNVITTSESPQPEGRL